MRTTVCRRCGKSFLTSNYSIMYCSRARRDGGKKEVKETTVKRKLSYMRIFIRDEFRCIYCGRTSIEDGVKLHLDHILPRSLVDNDHADNLVTACADCNTRKGGMLLPLDLLAKIVAVVEKRNRERGIDPDLDIKIGAVASRSP